MIEVRDVRRLVERLRSSEFVVPETLVGKGVWMAAAEMEKLLPPDPELCEHEPDVTDPDWKGLVYCPKCNTFL